MPNLDPTLRVVDETGDGRRARRDRNRTAVVDALLACYDEGIFKPSVADIAARSGVSHRSVFRYFDDLDDLTRMAISRGHERYDPLAKIHEIGKGPLETRIERIVSQRIALFKAITGPARAGRIDSNPGPSSQSDLVRIRLFLRAQLAKQFAPELKVLDRAEECAMMVALDLLCSFESFELLRNDHTLTDDKIAEALSAAIRQLLAPRSATPAG